MPVKKYQMILSAYAMPRPLVAVSSSVINDTQFLLVFSKSWMAENGQKQLLV